MARVSKEEKQASHARILNEAARLFREKGIEATGVAEVMSAAGFTHGGFYRHFASKDELVCAAISKAFEDIASALEREIEQHGARQAIGGYVKQYLSKHHVGMPGKGCPIAALGAEAGRAPEACKQVFNRGAEQLIDLLVQAFKGAAEERRTSATGLMTTLVGSLVMARSARSKTKMKAILTAGHRAAVGQLSS